MGYTKLPTRAWKDPLGPGYLNQMLNSISFLRNMADREHIIATGEHNAREVPRVVRKISGTTVSPASSDITAVTNPSAGKYVLTLAAGRFTSTDMRVQLNIRDAALGISLGMATYNLVSSTSLEVYTWLMNSTFYNPTVGGTGGNSWVATNLDFDIAISSTPIAVGTWNSLPGVWNRGLNGGGLTGTATFPSPNWSAMIQEQSEIQRVLLLAHDSAGEHAVREVAKSSAWVRYSGGAYTTSSTTITSAVAGGGGIIITHPNWTVHHAFVSSFSGSLVGYCVQTSATTTLVQLYVYFSPLGWQQASSNDFFLVLHGA